MNDAIETVVITGASAGVGRAIARKFAINGARIGLLARGREGLEAARKEVEELGGKALVGIADVAYADQSKGPPGRIEANLAGFYTRLITRMPRVFRPSKKRRPEECRA